jgi:hypothetical protein
MAAITGTAVTNVDLALNTAAEMTYTVATNSGTAGTDTETFEITPAKADSSFVIFVKNASGASVSFVILKGDMWAATADSSSTTVADGKVFGVTVDGAKYRTKDGKIKVKVTPTAGTALNASSKVQIGCLEI